MDRTVYRKIAETSQSGLDENVVAEGLERMGIAEGLLKLSGEKEEIAIKGIADLLKINHLGLEVESKDESIVANVDTEPGAQERIAYEVRSQLELVQSEFHKSRDWMQEAAKSLVDASLSKDPETQNNLKNRAADLPAAYINSLEKAGAKYSDHQTDISWAQNSGVVDAYLSAERPANIAQMKGLLDHSLVPNLGRLNTNSD